MRIEESIICDHEVRSQFLMISRPIQLDNASIYQSLEKDSGVLVSIKEVPVSQVNTLS